MGKEILPFAATWMDLEKIIQNEVNHAEEDKYYIGRTEYDSPEVDCEVLIEKEKPTPTPSLKGREDTGYPTLKIGEFYTVTIQKTEDFDLYASL